MRTKKGIRKLVCLCMTATMLVVNPAVMYAAEDRPAVKQEQMEMSVGESISEESAAGSDTIGKSEIENEIAVSDNNVVSENNAAEEDTVSSDDVKTEVEEASRGTTAEGFEYDTKTDGLYITGYTGSGTNLTVPDKINGVNVIGIFDNAFENKSSIQYVTLPNTIKKLGKIAFKNCTGLKKITIKSDLAAGSADSTGNASFFDEANSIFYNAGDSQGFTVVFEDGVTLIPAYLFATGHNVESGVYCKVNKVVIPESVKSVGEYAFYKCNKLDSVSGGTGIETIGQYSFSEAAFANIGYEGGFPFIPSLKSVGERAFSSNKLVRISLSSDNVLAIGKEVFVGNTPLEDVVLGKNVGSVGDGAFMDISSLKNVSLSDSVTGLGKIAFKNCTGLKQLTVRSDLAAGSSDSKGSASFFDEANSIFYNAGDPLGFTVIFEDGVTLIPSFLFATGHDAASNVYCKVNKIVIPDSVKSIGEYAFYKCNKLNTLTGGRGIETLGNNSFNGAAFTSIGCDDGFPGLSNLKTIGDGAFYSNKIERINLSSNNVVNIGKEAFIGNTPMKDVILGKNIGTVGDGAFRDLTSLESVSLSDSVTKLGKIAFKNCSGLKQLTVRSDLAGGDPDSKGDASFFDEASSIFYNAGDPLGFSVVFEEGVTIVPEYLFSTGKAKDKNVYCRISSVRIPSTVKSIGQYAFNRCYKLTEIAFSGSAPKFGTGAFEGVSAHVTYPNNNSTWTDEIKGSMGGEMTWEAVEPPYIPVISVTLNKNSVELGYEDTYQLVATVYPELANDKAVTWTSDKPEIAEVDKDGLVSSKNKDGSAVITVSTVSGNKTASCTVTVKEGGSSSEEGARSGLDPTVIVGNKEADGSVNIYLVKGQTYTLSANTTWTSSDPSKASVSKKRILKAKKAGDVIISGGGVTYKAHIAAPVVDKTKTVLIGKSETISLSGVDNNYSTFWYSANPAVASVSRGKIKGIAKGKVNVTAYVGGKAYVCKVTVKDQITVPKIPEKNSTITFMPMQNATIKLPGNIAIKKGTWTSSNGDLKKPVLSNGNEANYYQNEIVQVTPNGKITAIGVGSTTLTVETDRGVNTFTVKVPEPSERKVYVGVGKSVNVKYTGVKTGGRNRAAYSVSSADIASVADSGKVTGRSYGKTTVTCTYKPYDQGGFTFKSTVYVEDPAFSFGKEGRINNNASKTMKTGDKVLLKTDHVYQPVLWKSAKNAVAFIDENGNIRARQKGKTKLTTVINKKKFIINLSVTN